jgi:hypothetical protein
MVENIVLLAKLYDVDIKGSRSHSNYTIQVRVDWPHFYSKRGKRVANVLFGTFALILSNSGDIRSICYYDRACDVIVPSSNETWVSET